MVQRLILLSVQELFGYLPWVSGVMLHLSATLLVALATRAIELTGPDIRTVSVSLRDLVLATISVGLMELAFWTLLRTPV